MPYFQEWWTTGFRKYFFSLSDHLKLSSLFFLYQFCTILSLYSPPFSAEGMFWDADLHIPLGFASWPERTTGTAQWTNLYDGSGGSERR